MPPESSAAGQDLGTVATADSGPEQVVAGQVVALLHLVHHRLAHPPEGFPAHVTGKAALSFTVAPQRQQDLRRAAMVRGGKRIRAPQRLITVRTLRLLILQKRECKLNYLHS